MPFKKGDKNINRGGRPKKKQCMAEILRAIGEEFIDTKGGKITKVEALMRMVYKEAIGGNNWAVNFISDKCEGKPTQTINTNSTGEVPKINLVIKDMPEDKDGRRDNSATS